MPVVAEGTRRMLLDAAGRPVGRYQHAERDGATYADVFVREPGVGVEQAARAVLTDLRGVRVAADVALGRRLAAAGGRPLRHGHVLSRDLVADPAPDRWPAAPGHELTGADRPAADLLDAFRAAYPAGHPDHRAEPPAKTLADLDAMVSGRGFGPLLPGSGLAIARDGAVGGAILLADVHDGPPFRGPWVIELFRHPAHRGVGRPLLERGLALATAARLPALGLVVTEGNPARALYDALRFRPVTSFLVVEL